MSPSLPCARLRRRALAASSVAAARSTFQSKLPSALTSAVLPRRPAGSIWILTAVPGGKIERYADLGVLSFVGSDIIAGIDCNGRRGRFIRHGKLLSAAIGRNVGCASAPPGQFYLLHPPVWIAACVRGLSCSEARAVPAASTDPRCPRRSPFVIHASRTSQPAIPGCSSSRCGAPATGPRSSFARQH